MPPRFQRILSPRFLGHFRPGAPLRELLDPSPVPARLNGEAIDVQLRENDRLVFYHGGTSVLGVEASVRNPDRLRFDAHRTYRALCSDAWNRLNHLSEVGGREDISREAWRYIGEAVERIDVARPTYFRKEGLWQNRLSLTWGRRWSENDPWLIFDRESVIGFSDATEQRIFQDRFVGRYLAIRAALREAAPRTWGRTRDRDSLGNELDFLAISPEGELVCLELKHGTSAAGVYWGPLQVSVYRDMFADVLPMVSSGIRALIDQKIELGLLPPAAQALVPSDSIQRVSAALLIADPVSASGCWRKLEDVQAQLSPEHRVPVHLLNLDGSGRPVRTGPII